MRMLFLLSFSLAVPGREDFRANRGPRYESNRGGTLPHGALGAGCRVHQIIKSLAILLPPLAIMSGNIRRKRLMVVTEMVNEMVV